MSNPDEYISALSFHDTKYPEVVRIGNELAELESRKPHDSIKLLVVEEGQKKIDRLKAERQAKQQ